MRTLLLDQALWDLCLDAYSNIAVASNPYALGQDAASEIRTYRGEVWYDTTIGVPYFEEILGKWPPLAIIKQEFVSAALRVPEVVSAVCYISSLVGRQLSGQVQVTDKNGVLTPVSLS